MLEALPSVPMKRLVQPEILDSLPEGHPDAAANRRDLRLINRVMGNYLWLRSRLQSELRPDDRVLEIGAGTGDLGLYLRRGCPGRLPHYCGLDLWSRPAAWPRDWEWVQEDLLRFDLYSDFTVIIANLILHQFEDEALRELGRKLSCKGTRLILANEPARRKIHQWQLKLLHPLGLNHVSRHDGHVSVAAGFRHNELPELMGLTGPEWRVECRTGVLGACRMTASRQGGGST